MFRRRFGKVSWFWYSVARLYAWLFGWKLVGQAPIETKMIGIIAPHTSNWDVLLLYVMANSFRIKSNWLAKDTLLRPPLGWLLRPLGALPVERSRHHNYVEQVASIIRGQEHIYLAIAPEGTRGYTDCWKTGFYYIALAAKVPIICMKIDYGTKEMGFGPIVHPTGDLQRDCEAIFDFYRDVTPYRSSNRSAMCFKKE